MEKQDKRTPQAQAPSLILLESALIAAEKLTPSRAPRPCMDPNEALAAQLIERIKHPRPIGIPGWRIEPLMPVVPTLIRDMAGSDA